MTNLRTWLLLTVGLLVLAGCWGGSVTDPPQANNASSLPFDIPEVGSYPALGESDVLSPTGELMAFGLTSQEFYNNIQHAVATCMQLRGWTYAPELIDTSGGDQLTVGAQRAWVGRYGFGRFSRVPSSYEEGDAAREQNRVYLSRLSLDQREAYIDDFDGDAGLDAPLPGSCLAEAQSATSSILFHPAASREMAELFLGAWDTPQGEARRRAWRECMSLRGYDLGGPSDAYFMAESRGLELPLQDAIAEEIRIATDDFECQLETRLPFQHAVERRIVDYLIERYPELGRD